MKLWLQVEAGLGQNFLGDGHIYRRRERNHPSEYTQKIKRGKIIVSAREEESQLCVFSLPSPNASHLFSTHPLYPPILIM